MSGVFLRLTPAIDYQAVDDEPVDLVLALLALSWLTAESTFALSPGPRGRCVLPELRRQLRLAGSPDAIQALLSRESRPHAA